MNAIYMGNMASTPKKYSVKNLFLSIVLLPMLRWMGRALMELEEYTQAKTLKIVFFVILVFPFRFQSRGKNGLWRM